MSNASGNKARLRFGPKEADVRRSAGSDVRLRPRPCLLSWCAVSGLLIVAAGCQSEPSPPPLPDKVTEAVYRLSDDAGHPERFKSLFVDGAAPDEKLRPQYAQSMFSVLETKPVDETQAELKVQVTDATGQPKGEVRWTVVNDRGNWKLKTAPLP